MFDRLVYRCASVFMHVYAHKVFVKIYHIEIEMHWLVVLFHGS